MNFYKLTPLRVGTGVVTPKDFIEYKDDNIPLELQEALEQERIGIQLATKIAEAKAYLASTDFKVLPDYDKDATDVIAKRQEAREFIRANGSFAI